MNLTKELENLISQIPPTLNSKFLPQPKNSFPREPIPYICGLRARIECEHRGEHSTRSDRVTNIGYWLSWEASPLPAAISIKNVTDKEKKL